MKKNVLYVIGILGVIGGTTAVMLPKNTTDTDISAALVEETPTAVATEAATAAETTEITTAAEVTEAVTEAIEETTEPVKEDNGLPVFIRRSEEPRSIAVSSSEATKESIYHMMLNTVDYFSKASGTVIINSDFIEKPNCVTFQTNLDTGYAYAYEHSYDYVSNIYDISCNDLLDEYRIASVENFFDNKNHIRIDHIYKNYATKPEYPMDDYRIPDEQRLTKDKRGINQAAYRPDITKVYLASRSLYPQGFTMGALHDFDLWNIEEVTEFDGCECFRITGTPDESYAGKTRIHNYEMYVNTHNGCIMWLQGFNENGELVFYVYTDDLRFDDKAEDHKKAPDTIPEGYTELEN